MAKLIYIIDNDNHLQETLKKILKDDEEYKVKKVEVSKLEEALRNIPSLIIINEDTVKDDIFDVCKEIKLNEDNSITPTIVISSTIDKQHRVNILKEGVEYFIKSPIDEDYLYLTIKNIVELLYNNRKVSPLTGLPGNVQIQAEIKKRMLKKEDFVLMYLDLDNFKAYNDVYGFLNGDEIIKFTARTISRNVSKMTSEDEFVGHIGGDDFVAIVSTKDNFENICQHIIAEFEKEVVEYFNEEDLEKGYLEVENRKGQMEEFPIMSISVAAVVNDKSRFESELELGEVGAQVKHLAKTIAGSSYVIDRRKDDINK